MSIQGKTRTVAKILLTRQTANTPILPLKELEENLMINLSIEDYELICRNAMVKRMMSRTLETDVEKLTELCRNMEKFKEFVELNLRTIREREKAKKTPIKDLPLNLLQGMKAKTLSLLHIPDDALNIIISNYQSILKYELREWVPKKKLEAEFLSENLNAIYFLSLPENAMFINWDVLSKNPNAIDFLSLPKNKKHINYHQLSKNASPKAIELLRDKIIEEKGLSPEEFAKLEKYEKINWKILSKNPEAIEILTSPENYDNIYWKGLSSNPNPKAIEFLLLDKNFDFIDWYEFSRNPCDSAIKNLNLYDGFFIDWDGLCENTNPKAIPIIKEKVLEERKLLPTEYAIKGKVNWRKLSSNLNAIELIIMRIKDESKLNEDEYRSLKLQYKIDWDALSLNPSIFIPFKPKAKAKSITVTRILPSSLISPKAKAKANTSPIRALSTNLKDNFKSLLPSKNVYVLRHGIPLDKLNWNYLSKNPNAIDLLEKQIEIEKHLSKEEYDRLPSKINWSSLCSNPNAIDLLDANQDKIDWSVLSYNPNAIHLLEKRVKYQLSLKGSESKSFLNSIYTGQRVSWVGLAGNPSIFIPM